MKPKSIGVIGGGFVGGAIGRYFEKTGHAVRTYDKFKEIDPLEEVLLQDFIFIAVPTPYNNGIDLSAMDDAMANVAKCPEGKIVVIKSTVIPGTTEKYQEKYPHLNILFNPEFLTEKTGDQDFSYPDRQIVGYTKKSFTVAGDVMQILPLAPFCRIIPATEAELVKYFGNNWFSVKVVFANQMYDIAEKLGLDYDRIRDAVAADKRIGPSHLEVFHAGYRGYGGKCLPKDIRAMIVFAEKLGLDPKLLKATEEFNNILTGGVDKQ
jgi:UDPglucose 6-dehydrogenase